MFIYNVTVNLEEEIAADWLNWMRSKHIPDVLATGCFKSHKLCKVLTNDEGETYSIQYFFQEMKVMDIYLMKYAPGLQAEHKKRYGDKALAFRTFLKVVE